MMRLLTFALLLPAARRTLAVSLSSFQPIISFSSSCTAIYNAQLPSCTTNDFTNGHPCSTSCISALTTVEQQLNKACAGARADPNTLIGSFFQGKGVSVLCPNSGLAPVTTSDGIGESTMVESSVSSIPTSIVVASSSSASPASASSISSTSTTMTTRSSSSAAQSSSAASAAQSASSSTLSTTASSITSTSSTSTTAVAAQSPKSDTNKTTMSLRGQFSTTAINDGQATVLTSQAQRTDSSNPDAFGGGGSPFEVGDNAGVSLGINLARIIFVAVSTAFYVVLSSR